jgi:DNA-binding NarL/FixJ family response regulator
MAITGIAVMLHRAGNPVQGIRLMARAALRRDELAIPFRPTILDQVNATVAGMRDAVGVSRFAGAWQEGRSLSWDVAVALARAAVSGLTTTIPLSPREREVLALLAEGASDGDIADRLFISRRTASKHVAAILEKLQASNRTAAVTIALRRGLI